MWPSSQGNQDQMNGTGQKRRATTAQLAFLAASCILFSIIELSIPRFVPFFRLGLSNLTLLLGLALGLDFGSYAALMGLKLLSQAVTGGTLFSYVFVLSLAGTAGSGFLMFFLYRCRKVLRLSLVGISVAGALLSNLLQSLVATVFLGWQAMVLFVPVAGIGLVSSTLLGLLANGFVARSKFLDLFWVRQPNLHSEKAGEAMTAGQWVVEIVLVCVFVSIFFVQNLWYLGGVFVLASVLRKVHGRSLKQLRLVQSLVVVAAVLVLALLSPYGRVMLEVGSLQITEGAFEAGLARGIRLVATIALSDLLVMPLRMKRGGVIGDALSAVYPISESFSRIRVKDTKVRELLERVDAALCEAYSGTQDT